MTPRNATMAPVPVSETDDPDVIQRQIDHTRDQLAVTVNAIAERLSPDNLIELSLIHI